MNKIITILLFLCFMNMHGQEKLHLDFGAGIFSIKNNAAALFNAGAHFDLTQKISVSTSIGFAEFNIDDTLGTNLSKFDLGINYKVLNNNTEIASITNFTYITDKHSILFERENNFGIDLGILLMFNQDKKFNYGIKWYNTFSTTSRGSIMYSGAQFSYKL